MAAIETLTISEGLANLLVWILRDGDMELAEEVITKPEHFGDLAHLHARHPDATVAQIFDLMDAQGPPAATS